MKAPLRHRIANALYTLRHGEVHPDDEPRSVPPADWGADGWFEDPPAWDGGGCAPPAPRAGWGWFPVDGPPDPDPDGQAA